jgi:hypothetical protein
MIRNVLICFFALFGMLNVFAQSTTGKIVDAESGQGLPYAGILINDTENVIGNAEGYFTIPEKNTDDALLTISFMGYKTVRMTLGEVKRDKSIIKLQPGAFELEDVYISNVKINADSIMTSVRGNLKRNYKTFDQPVKNMLFYRSGLAFKPIRLKAEITESKGYKKKELKDANVGLQAFTSKLISHPPQEFTDMLCNYYTGKKTLNDKSAYTIGFEVVKAVKLKDKNRSVALDELEKMAGGVLFQHLDSTKYYRVKSGLFGTQDTVISRNTFFSSKKDVKTSELDAARAKVTSFMYANNLQYKKLDFISNHELYEYEYTGTTQSGGNESVYIIKFRPKKRKGKYAGTLYVSEKDYAVVRAEYMLGEGKTLGGVNLKFLLGIKQSENISKGTLIFKERSPEDGYYLQYASVETGQYIYVNRPIKFKEITEGEKDVVAFDLKVEANVLEKQEYFIMSQTDVTQADLKVNGKEVNYIELDSYDPNIWKEYSAIEPLEEMKHFRVAE